MLSSSSMSVKKTVRVERPSIHIYLTGAGNTVVDFRFPKHDSTSIEREALVLEHIRHGHGNLLNREVLQAALDHPDRYPSLDIKVCGNKLRLRHDP